MYWCSSVRADQRGQSCGWGLQFESQAWIGGYTSPAAVFEAALSTFLEVLAEPQYSEYAVVYP